MLSSRPERGVLLGAQGGTGQDRPTSRLNVSCRWAGGHGTNHFRKGDAPPTQRGVVRALNRDRRLCAGRLREAEIYTLLKKVVTEYRHSLLAQKVAKYTHCYSGSKETRS